MFILIPSVAEPYTLPCTAQALLLCVRRYPTVMFSTGPMFVTLQYVWYKRTHQMPVYGMPKELYSDECGRALFKHYVGSSWHGADSKLIRFLYHTLPWSVPAITFGLGAVLGHVVTMWQIKRMHKHLQQSQGGCVGSKTHPS